MRSTLAGAAALLALAVLAAPAAADVPVTLRGSPESMQRQHRQAREHGLAFVRTPAQVRELERRGELVRLEPNEDFGLREGVSHPVAHPTTRAFLERTAAGYREACGERLIVTSLTRPTTGQPANSHPLSVHPAGIAVDLRISQRAACRTWLERTLLALEAEGVLDVTREQRPPHYHVALFPGPYLAHPERTEPPALREPPPMEALLPLAEAAAPPLPSAAAPPPPAPTPRAAAALRPSRLVQRMTPGPWALVLALPLALLAARVLTSQRRP
jgi:hypothetical protein